MASVNGVDTAVDNNIKAVDDVVNTEYDPDKVAVRQSLPGSFFVNSPGVAFDIGGTRCKVAFIRNSAVNDKSRDVDDSSVTVEFLAFPRGDLTSAINYVKTHVTADRKREIKTTGTFLTPELRDTIEREFQAKVARLDEFSLSGKGLQFLLRTFSKDDATLFHDVSPSVYKYVADIADGLTKLMASVQQQQEEEPTAKVEPDSSTTVTTANEVQDGEDKPSDDLQSSDSNEAGSGTSKASEKYPYMLITSGSGTSCVLVTSPDNSNFVAGSPQGGLSIMGLSKLLLNVSDYNELMELADRGNEASVTIMSRDLRNSFGSEPKDFYDFLPPDVPMYPFARVLDKNSNNHHRPEDIANALVNFIIQNVVREVFWTASSFNCDTVYAAGGLFEHRLARDVFSQMFMSQAIFSGKPQMKCHILRLSTYLASLGALLSDTC